VGAELWVHVPVEEFVEVEELLLQLANAKVASTLKEISLIFTFRRVKLLRFTQVKTSIFRRYDENFTNKTFELSYVPQTGSPRKKYFARAFRNAGHNTFRV
jgi:hypothetical protein